MYIISSSDINFSTIKTREQLAEQRTVLGLDYTQTKLPQERASKQKTANITLRDRHMNLYKDQKKLHDFDTHSIIRKINTFGNQQ